MSRAELVRDRAVEAGCGGGVCGSAAVICVDVDGSILAVTGLIVRRD